MCTPRAARGRPRKESESPSEPPSSSPLVQRVNPERAARDRVLDSNATAETPEKEDISQVSSSQAHILDVLELMGCKEHESSVRRLPHFDNRCQVVNASEADIDATAMQRVDNVFLRGVKAWIHLLLPNLKLKCDSKLKAVCSIMSMAEEQLIAGQSTDELEIDEEDDVPTSVTTPIDVSMLTTIPNIIREVLQHETRYTSTDARKLLVPLSHVPSEYLASILRISNSYAKRLSFQAKVDQLYLIHGVKLQEFNQTHSRVHVDMIQSAVDFVYRISDGRIWRMVTLNSDGDDVCKQVRKERRRYKKRCLSISKREEHRVEKQHKDEEALNAIRIVYPQCTVCLYHFKSQVLLEGHVCGGLNEPKDALSVAMKYANQLLTKMNFTIRGAIDQASVMFQMEGTSEILFASFEPNFFPGWAHIRKNIHPELTNKVSSVIHECWKAGENKGTGKVKISADGVFERLEEMQSHNLIRLSELPVVGKIRAVYQCVGNKPQAPIGVRKRGRPHDSGSGDCGGRNVKNRVSFEQLDVGKELSTWKKPELEAYLHHFQLKKSGNKPDLIKRVEEHMAMQ
ncbi:hypothetical protein EMCRGX_G023024 [Ephydatia muelleri]